jgi:hypothetical protein
MDVTVLLCSLQTHSRVAREDRFTRTSQLVEQLSDRLRDRGGFVWQHLGDELLAVLPADATDAAVEAAIALHDDATRRDATLRAAVATGSVLVGTAGTGSQLSSIVLGDAVSLARSILSSMPPGRSCIRFAEPTPVSAATLASDDRAVGFVETPDGGRVAVREVGKEEVERDATDADGTR